MELTREERNIIIDELKDGLHGRLDGSRKNIIATCPFCGKKEKFGIYIGIPTERKKPFMCNCFSCQRRADGLVETLKMLERMDLMPVEVVDIEVKLDLGAMFPLEEEEDELDDTLVEVSMPGGYKQTFFHNYLNERGFECDDYDYFPVGATEDWKMKDYVIFPVIDGGKKVGFVARHVWDKKKIDAHNTIAKRQGKYPIQRFRNSEESNEFVKLLYNYDSVIEDETESVILLEGIFDVIGITRELNLYDNHRIVPVATFGKKISDIQIYKLQKKGVRNVILGYDPDAVEVIKKLSSQLNEYFDVFIASSLDSKKDYGDMFRDDFWETFAYNIKTPREFTLTKIQD